jgi:imidazolonepropionase-like amidohydrolase
MTLIQSSATFLAKISFLLVTASAVLQAPSATAETLLLTGATVHTISGETFSPGQVLLKDNQIVAVGKTVPANGAKTIDLSGQHLYPGMIALDSMLGLMEIGAVRATQDSTEVGDFTPDVESWIAVNPDSELIPVTRANGIAYFEPVPQGGLVSGQSGLVAVEGWTSEQRTFKKPIALHLFWPAMTLDLTPREGGGGRRPGGRGAGEGQKSLEDQAKDRRAKLRELGDFFDEAKAYAKARATAPSQQTPRSAELVPAWEAMLPYVRGDLPITIHADEIRQIKTAVEWATTNHYKMILAGGRDAWMAADLLASNKVPVIYEATYELPSRDSESYDVHFKAPQVLHKAGVQVAFGLPLESMSGPNTRNLPYEAAQAMAFGLPEDEALKGLMLYPAQFAGVADRLGSIEPGKEATLLASDGDILDIRSNVKHLWVDGKEVNLDSRHTKLYDKYKDRPRPAQPTNLP